MAINSSKIARIFWIFYYVQERQMLVLSENCTSLVKLTLHEKNQIGNNKKRYRVNFFVFLIFFRTLLKILETGYSQTEHINQKKKKHT